MTKQATVVSAPLFAPRQIGSKRTLTVFIAVQATGGLANLLLLLTAALSKRIHRETTWLSSCLCWVVFAFSYSLLAFTGHFFAENPSANALCILQTALVYSAPVLCSAALLSLMLSVYIGVSRIIGLDRGRYNGGMNIFMIVYPYILWLVMFIAMLITALISPQDIGQDNDSPYCHILTGIPGHVSVVVTGIFVVGIIILQLLTGKMILKSRLAHLKLRSVLPTSILIRSNCFVGFFLVGYIFSAVALSEHRASSLRNMFLAIAPLANAVTFGTQRDIIKVWLFRRPPTQVQDVGPIG